MSKEQENPCHELFGVECEIRVRVRVSVAERKAEWLWSASIKGSALFPLNCPQKESVGSVVKSDLKKISLVLVFWQSTSAAQRAALRPWSFDSLERR